MDIPTDRDRESLRVTLLDARGTAVAHALKEEVEAIDRSLDKLENEWPDCFEEVCKTVREAK